MSRTRDYADASILPQGAIIEFVAQGSYVKVSAVDPVTYEEVSIVGDRAAGEKDLTRLACRKLERIVQRKHGTVRERKRGLKPGTLVAKPRDEPPSGWDL